MTSMPTLALSFAEVVACVGDKQAVIMADDAQSLSFAALEAASSKLARQLRRDAQVGDRVAILLPNGPQFLIAAWAARRAGLRYVPINWHLHKQEAAYIVADSDAVILISDPAIMAVAEYAATHAPLLKARYSTGAAFGSFIAVADLPEAPAIVEYEGGAMFYSSGTTGKPKGILTTLSGALFGQPHPFDRFLAAQFGFSQDSVYLSPAPLYHAAPLSMTMCSHSLGATAVVMRKFDAEEALAAIERYRVTHVKFVPTHFVRMLTLPEAIRHKYDMSSLQTVIHAAAPCPPQIKRRMIDWLGPIIHEYYGASEGGFTVVNSHDWLDHPGTVGRPLGCRVHILDDEGRGVGAGELGTIYFETSMPAFEYHKDSKKTREVVNERGWIAPGDIGYVDEDGYLFLADRKSDMIISGGVNVYPQEVENVLTGHPQVADVAVIGVPDAEYGQQVKAVVVPVPGAEPRAELAALLIEYCRENLSAFKCPRSVDFTKELPRLPTGKLLKRRLVEDYSLRLVKDQA